MSMKDHLEHFSLRWNNYNDNMKTGFHDLLTREDFVDVTIAAEGKLIQAHKMVLSICSPYFRNIFKTNPCQHPVVFLKDVTHAELSGILQFMYLGEVNVKQEELPRFLKTAEALQIKGLSAEENNIFTTYSDVGKQQKGKPRFNDTCKSKTRVTPAGIQERGEAKKMKIDSENSVPIQVNAHVPVIQVPEKAAVNHDGQTSKIIVKNEPPELNFNDIQCEGVPVMKENGSDCFFKENTAELDTEEDDSIDVPDPNITGTSSGVGPDFSTTIGTNDLHKAADQQGTEAPALTKSQGLCSICGKILQHRKNLQTHVLDQHSGVFGCWPCTTCKKICRTWSALRVHNNRHHSNAPPVPVRMVVIDVTHQKN